jgi:hypothetical protein
VADVEQKIKVEEVLEGAGSNGVIAWEPTIG